MLAVLVANQIERQTPRMLDKNSMSDIPQRSSKKPIKTWKTKQSLEHFDEF